MNGAQPGWPYEAPHGGKLGGSGYWTKQLNCPWRLLAVGTIVHDFGKKRNVVQKLDNTFNVAIVSQSLVADKQLPAPQAVRN